MNGDNGVDQTIGREYGELLAGCAKDLGVNVDAVAAIVARTARFLDDPDERARVKKLEDFVRALAEQECEQPEPAGTCRERNDGESWCVPCAAEQVHDEVCRAS